MNQRKRILISVAVTFIVIPSAASALMFAMFDIPLRLGLVFFIGGAAVLWTVELLRTWLSDGTENRSAQGAADIAKDAIKRAALKARRNYR